MYLFKKRTANPYSFLDIDTNLDSDKFFLFRKNLLDRM